MTKQTVTLTQKQYDFLAHLIADIGGNQNIQIVELIYNENGVNSKPTKRAIKTAQSLFDAFGVGKPCADQHEYYEFFEECDSAEELNRAEERLREVIGDDR